MNIYLLDSYVEDGKLFILNDENYYKYKDICVERLVKIAEQDFVESNKTNVHFRIGSEIVSCRAIKFSFNPEPKIPCEDLKLHLLNLMLELSKLNPFVELKIIDNTI